jgi:hypothetical protein
MTYIGRWARPGAEMAADNEVAERKSAIGLCQIHKSLVAEGDAMRGLPPRTSAALSQR